MNVLEFIDLTLIAHLPLILVHKDNFYGKFGRVNKARIHRVLRKEKKKKVQSYS